MNCHDSVAMWSSVVLFVLTFAVFGLLLGFAAVYDTNQEGQMGNNSNNSGGTVTRLNLGNNTTQSSQSSSANAN